MSEQVMQRLAKKADRALNGKTQGAPRRNGFVILAFPFDGPEGQRVNYVSNANREDMIAAMKEIIARFEGRVVTTDTVQ